MGLSVVVYKNIEFFSTFNDEEYSKSNYPENKKIFELYLNENFPKQGEGLIDKSLYTFEEKLEGWQSSYSGFGDWREKLAKLVGYKAVSTEGNNYASRKMSHLYGVFERTDGDFHELLYFSDCEGSINTKTSKKLYIDFQKWDERAKNLNDRVFYNGYKIWLNSFKFASQNGVVCYH